MDLKMTNLRVDASGEGSRGGKIVGHTSGGKPIYGVHNHPEHDSFTREEHTEAAQLHQAKMGELRGKDKGAMEHHKKQRNAHSKYGSGDRTFFPLKKAPKQ